MRKILQCVQTLTAFLVLVLSIPPMVANAAELPSNTEIRNLEYNGIYEHAIVLVDGLYEGPPFVPGGASRPRVKLLEGLTVTGDLDSDGNPEAVVLLGENSGGSGENIYLALVARRGNVVKNLDTKCSIDKISAPNSTISMPRPR